MNRAIRWMRNVSVMLGAGLLLASATCVQNLADTVGTGLTLTGATGVLGDNSQAVTNVGAGLDLFADVMRLAH